MGDFWDTPIPTLGEIGTSLKDKFGRVAGNLAGQAQAFTLAQKYGHGGFDAAPDNDPAASAVAPKAPRADIQGASSYLAPNASTDQVATTLRGKFGGPSGGGITPAIAEGAYQDQPGYGEFGSSGPRSLAQMLQDREAAAQLDASYGARERSNQAFAPDYQGDALRGRQREAEYEALSTPPRPLFSSGQTLGSFYKNGNTISNEPTGLTLRESIANQQNQLKNAPGLLDLGRGRLAEELQGLKAQYDAEVRTGKRTQPDADAAYARALQKANELASLLKSGFPPNDPNAIPGGTTLAPQLPNK